VDTPGASDRTKLIEMFDRCSLDTVVRRFFGLVRQLPARYLDDVLAGRPELHDAVVARLADGPIVGLASLGTGDGPPELGVLVEDAWQQRGIGTALVDALLVRARDRGVATIVASVLPGRERVLSGLDKRFPGHLVENGRDTTAHVYAL
jgi:GNAT superfamily N-acetyltransferase